MSKPSFLVIVGQTASGKSSLAMNLARELGGEIICADSLTVYRGLDIGTAKPSKGDQAEIRHHLLDVADFSEAFNVSRFKDLANAAIADVRSRDKLPILVGGSGLYVNSVVYDFSFGGSADQALRRELEEKTVEELRSIIAKQEIALPENSENKRYLVRAIERSGHEIANSPAEEGTVIVGLRWPKEVLEQRIRGRLKEMLDEGVLDEVRMAWAKYRPGSEALKGNIYMALKPYLDDEASLDDCLEDFVRLDLRLAKKQLSWFKRDKNIQWFKDPDQAHDYVTGISKA